MERGRDYRWLGCCQADHFLFRDGAIIRTRVMTAMLRAHPLAVPLKASDFLANREIRRRCVPTEERHAVRVYSRPFLGPRLGVMAR